MGEQAVDAIFRDGQLRVVIVVGMNRDAVGERREACRQAQIAADDRRSGLSGDTQRVEVTANDVRGLRSRTGQRQAETVEYRSLAQTHHVAGNIARPGADDKVGDVGGQRSIDGDGRAGILGLHENVPIEKYEIERRWIYEC